MSDVNNVRNRRLAMRTADLKWFKNDQEIKSLNYSGTSDLDYDLFYKIEDNNQYEKIVIKNNIMNLSLTQDYDNPLIIGDGFDNYTTSIIQDSNSKYVIVGGFQSYSGISSNYIIRLNNDGSIDNTFNSGSGFDVPPYGLIIDNNKYIIYGEFQSYSGISSNYIIRLNNDGSIDNTFNSGSGFDNIIYSTIKDLNGKYLICGEFTSYSGATRNRIIRLNQNGSIDNTFNSGTGFNDIAYSLIQDIDGKYVIIGDFTSYSGATRNRIIRLNQNGSIDNTFNSGTGFNDNVYSLIQDIDGKYVIVGNFTSYSGVTRNRIIRLNQDGTIDNTFNSGTGFNDNVYSLIQDIDGKYVIVGDFTSYSGVTRNRIIRLNQDGTIDNTFNSGTGFNAPTSSIIINQNNKYLVCGGFIEYSGVSVNWIINLNQDGLSNTISS